MTARVPHRTAAVHEFRGLRTTEHYFTVPLDHSSPNGESIEVFGREYSDPGTADGGRGLPWLLYLQGGPGGRGGRVTSLGGWMKEAAKSFRIFMLDQRGTGLSAPANRQTLPLRGDARAQAEYLSHFRADSIVADAELIRQTLTGAPWTVLGQSYGGFCALTYLSFAPEGLAAVLITGGLAPLTGPADRVYEATYARVEARNREYFQAFPEDRGQFTRIMRHVARTEEYLPTGERLTPGRVQMAGSFLGGNTRFNALHYLLEDAFVSTPAGLRLSDLFLDQLGALVTRAPNPLYAVMHESIYAQGGATAWAAERVLDRFPQFRAEAAEPLLTGEMVYRWYFEQDPALVPLRETAALLAAKDDWKPLYDVGVLGRNAVPAAAAVYRNDIYVDRNLSLETAAAVRNLRVWETADYHHDGISDNGAAVFRRLLALTRGEAVEEETAR